MLINEYLKYIYIYHVPKKSIKYLDNIAIYVENKVVYKVVLRYSDKVWKQLRKLKLSKFKFIYPPPEEITDDIVKNDKHERLTIIFDKKREVSNIVVGERMKTI